MIGGSTFAIFMISSILSLLSGGNLSAIMVFAIPYWIEPLVILYNLIPEPCNEHQIVDTRNLEENDLSESLLPKHDSPKSINVKDTHIFGIIEWWFYESIDKHFMPDFCNKSLKKSLFSLPSSLYYNTQILTLCFLSIQLFLGLMSSATTEIAPLLSIICVIYTVLSLYSFLDPVGTKFIDLSTSYFASFKLSAFCLGYLFDAYTIGRLEWFYSLLTLVITCDAYYGLYKLIEEQKISRI
jgi:hypothetical protein